MLALIALLALVQFSSAAEICCANTGDCFTDNAPFGTLPLPTCATSANTGYLMFTRTNRDVGQTLTEITVPSVYVPSRRTVFLAHGWNTNGNAAWLTSMKNAYLDREDINVVIVNWGTLAQLLNYLQAASNTRSVGSLNAAVFRNLLSVPGSLSSRFWCAGHSLGSHVCGHTGMLMRGSALGRVTGLDPAGPFFEGNADKNIGLNPSSASFVDILHTDSLELGTLRDLGHIDFYPNGGKDQPGCVLRQFNDETFDNWESEDFALASANSCAHSRAYEFLESSIRSDCFQARQRCTNYNSLPGSCTECTSGAFPCAYMGYAAESSINRSGLYHLTVTASPPFCTN
jgi:hypothetical protein